MKKHPTQERLRELFGYHKDGFLVRKQKRGGADKGRILGNLTTNKYLRTGVDNQQHHIHRLIFIYHLGYNPNCDIDHINRDRVDNRIENLRPVTRSVNMRNTKLYNTNTSGRRGVTWDKVNEKWVAQVCTDGKTRKIGRYVKLSDAVKAREEEESRLGYLNA